MPIMPLADSIRKRFPLHFNRKVLIIILLTSLCTSCLVKHYEFPLVKSDGQDIVLYADSNQMISMTGSITPYNDVIGSNDPIQVEALQFSYFIKGIDKIEQLRAKISIYVPSGQNLLKIENGEVSYNWDSLNYTALSTAKLTDTITITENFNKDLVHNNYFLIIETDPIMAKVDQLFVKSYISFLHRSKRIEVDRIDTLYKKTISEYQFRVH